MSRRFIVRPEFRSRLVVEVRIARTAALMRGEFRRIDGDGKGLDDCEGLCRTWHRPRRECEGRTRARGVVARIYLNAQHLARRPGEIVSHECGHAAMGVARYRRADLGRMPGEEVMCYALGRLVAQVNRVCYAAGAFR